MGLETRKRWKTDVLNIIWGGVGGMNELFHYLKNSIRGKKWSCFKIVEYFWLLKNQFQSSERMDKKQGKSKTSNNWKQIKSNKINEQWREKKIKKVIMANPVNSRYTAFQYSTTNRLERRKGTFTFFSYYTRLTNSKRQFHLGGGGEGLN